MDKLYESDNPNSKFLKGYLIYVVVLLVIALGVTGYLWFRLARYQAGIEAEAEEEALDSGETSAEDDEKAAQKCFTEYVESLGAEGWKNIYYADHPERMDTEEDVLSFVTEKIMDSGYSCYKADDFAPEAPKYVLMVDGTTIAEVSLLKNGNDWGIEKAEILLTGDNTITIKAPAGSNVYVNGNELSEDYITVEKEAATLEDYDEDLENPVIFNKYTISGMIGDAAEVQVDNGYLACDDTYYDIISDGQSKQEKAEEFVKSLLHYYAMGKENTESNQAEALSYVAGSSNASKVIYAAASGLEWVPADYSLSYTTETSEILKLADNCFCIDVAYELEGGRNNSSKTEDNSADTMAEDSEGESEDNAPDDGTDDEETQDDNSHGVYRVYFLSTSDSDDFRIVEFAGIK